MKFKELVRYNLNDYFRSTKFILPIIAIALLQIGVYGTSPLQLIDSVLISSIYTFLIMIWVGYSYNSLEDETSQELIILKMRSSSKYYLSQGVLLACLCTFVSLICSFVPSISDIISQHTVFERTVTSGDLFSFIILFLGTTFSGAFLGSLIHPRIISNKKNALVLVLLIAVLCLIKTVIISEKSYLAYFLWVLPPISSMVEFFSKTDFLRMDSLIGFTIIMFIYSLGYLVVRILLLSKIKF